MAAVADEVKTLAGRKDLADCSGRSEGRSVNTNTHAKESDHHVSVTDFASKLLVDKAWQHLLIEEVLFLPQEVTLYTKPSLPSPTSSDTILEACVLGTKERS